MKTYPYLRGVHSQVDVNDLERDGATYVRF
jgi:hypothetical protein